jgi:hypothetical protein
MGCKSTCCSSMAAPAGDGGRDLVAVDGELAGGLPQPDLVGQGVGGLGQLPPLPQDARLREGIAPAGSCARPAGPAEHPMIGVEPPPAALIARSRQVVADLAAGADGLGQGALACSQAHRRTARRSLSINTHTRADQVHSTYQLPVVTRGICSK